jgi:hypothetical protein
MEKKPVIQQESAANKKYTRFQSSLSNVVAVKPATLTTIAVQPINLRNSDISLSLSEALPQRLKHVQDSISEAQSLLNLADNWDDNGAYKVSKNTFDNALSFLKRYTLFIFNDLKVIIAAPDINPVKDGSIDLEWHTPHARMLINLKNTGEIAYYGDNLNDLNSIKGKVAGDSVQKFLAVWMTKLKNG